MAQKAHIIFLVLDCSNSVVKATIILLCSQYCLGVWGQSLRLFVQLFGTLKANRSGFEFIYCNC